MDRHEAINHDYAAYVEGTTVPDLDFELSGQAAELLRLTREAAYRHGWDAGQQWQAHAFSTAPTVRITRPIRTLEAGESAWIQPHAIIENGTSGELFLDPRFATRPARSTGFTIRVSKLDEGFVALGPTDQHRIHLQPISRHFLPLLRLDPEQPETPTQHQ